MQNLFTYGTLMCQDIMLAILNQNLIASKATLNGFERKQVKNKVYPGLVHNPNKMVEGLVYFNIPNESWEKLDYFEGEMYDKKIINVKLADGSISSAATYIIKNKCINQLEDFDWNFEHFLSVDKNSFIKQLH